MDIRKKINKLSAIDFKKYENIDLDHLVMYAISKLDEIGADLSYENTVVASFKLFPQKFSLLGYEEYPDSDRIRNCLNRCILKNRQWLGGKAQYGFFLTDRSKVIIERSQELLNEIVINKTGTKSLTRRKEMILSEIKNSVAFSEFNSGNEDRITEGEVCYLLQGTLDTPRSILKQNLSILKIYSQELNNEEVIKFLDLIQTKFHIFLNK